MVIFVVIVLPMVLEKERKPIGQDLVIQIPSQDAAKFNASVLPPKAVPDDLRQPAATIGSAAAPKPLVPGPEVPAASKSSAPKTEAALPETKAVKADATAEQAPGKSVAVESAPKAPSGTKSESSAATDSSYAGGR